MEKEFRELLEIDLKKGSLSKYKAKIPSLVYHYGLIDNKLHDNLEIIKNKLKISTSKVKSGLRIKYKRSRVTLSETELNELIVVETSYKKIKEYERKIRKINSLIRLSKLRLQTLKLKSEMLINIAHNERLERSSKIR